jgi:uncharacterized protein involved in copper resistance
MSTEQKPIKAAIGIMYRDQLQIGKRLRGSIPAEGNNAGGQIDTSGLTKIEMHSTGAYVETHTGSRYFVHPGSQTWEPPVSESRRVYELWELVDFKE